ncbi:unnamed protein product [Phytophthora fragariaefolia]|uniref:Unnamed protein product n=1 Tax=Phytophthora fragariaefolia TaxID=1490495 RepID=A0A9W7CW84_9STRA|nr:unnamed protein product [Phytophthora fragariaefolia]
MAVEEAAETIRGRRDGRHSAVVSEQLGGDGVADSQQRGDEQGGDEQAGYTVDRVGGAAGGEQTVDECLQVEDYIDGRQGGIVDEHRESTNGDVVSASQIDCSVMLSAPTLDSIFESSNHVGGVNSVVEEGDQDVVVGVLQRLLSEGESDTHVGDSEEEKCSEGDLPNNNLSLPESTTDDVKFFKDGEDASAYENLDSCGSDEDDESDEAVVEPREYPDDANMSDEEATHVDEAFLESLGGSLDMDHIDKEALRNTR